MGRARERGLTMLEALVTIVVMVSIMLGLYALLDSSNAVSKK